MTVEPTQLELVVDAADERGWHEWFVSLPREPAGDPPDEEAEAA